MAIPAQVTPMDAKTYLRLERASETKHELIDGVRIAMSGASYAHNVIVSNLVRLLGNALHTGPCRALASDMRVNTSRTGMYAYPDVVVHCDRPRFEDEHFDTLLNPVVLFEVLSPSTERYDRGVKFARYAASRRCGTTSWSRRTKRVSSIIGARERRGCSRSWWVRPGSLRWMPSTSRWTWRRSTRASRASGTAAPTAATGFPPGPTGPP